MASFDVQSLFTNIPLIKTIIICDELCERSGLTPYNPTTSQFKLLSKLTIKESLHFQNSNRLYQQVDGVTMGSPLEPTLANVFLSYH